MMIYLIQGIQPSPIFKQGMELVQAVSIPQSPLMMRKYPAVLGDCARVVRERQRVSHASEYDPTGHTASIFYPTVTFDNQQEMFQLVFKDGKLQRRRRSIRK
jgi:hypothetical protein